MIRLARALGMTTEVLLDSVSSSELAEWQDYYSIEPWPWQLMQLAIANQTSWLVAIKGGKAKIDDCMLKFSGPKRVDDSAALAAWAAAHNANVGSKK